MNIKLLSLTILLVSFSSCTFVTPNYKEQQVLLEKGSFAGGAPPWLASPRAGANPGAGLGGGSSFGIMPQSFASNNQQNNTLEENDSLVDRRIKQEVHAPVVKKNVESSSPLIRITQKCPSVESDVTAALTTLDLKDRIRKYESLTNRCPDSWDLWLWLGKDYEKNKESVKAGRCFEKALVINNSSEEAQKLLDDNRRRLNMRVR
ncbi:MAG: hypothetical protein KBC84_05795 [Proteobacteria bacterium]|nr:hypothetical protein [Pseudomonadota bacterium]